MKKIFTLMLSVLLLAVVFATAAPGEAYLSPAIVTVASNGDFILSLKAEPTYAATSPGVSTVDFTVSFDKTKLSVKSIDKVLEGSADPTKWAETGSYDADGSDGSLRFSMNNLKGKAYHIISSDKPLNFFKITFTSVSGATGNTDIQLKAGPNGGALASGVNALQGSLKGTTVTIQGGDCTPKTCTSEGFECGTVSDGCTGTLNCGTCTGGYVCAGNVCHAPPPGTEDCTTLGDESGDGIADCLDSSCLGKIGPNNKKCCNSNADANVDKIADQCLSIRPFCNVAVGECDVEEVGSTETIGQRIDKELETAKLDKTQKSWSLELVSKIAKALKDWFGGK